VPTEAPEPDDSTELSPVDERQRSAFDALLRQLARAPRDEHATSMHAFTTGTVLAGRFEVIREIGRGGFARVLEAQDLVLSRPVAIKLLRRHLSDPRLAGDPELVRRFEQEARLAGSLNHPNLVAVYDVGLHEGAPYFITELLHGESLRHRLSRGRVPVDSALDWAAQLAQGLAAAHARGIIHRDVKPGNIFVTSDGHVKLLDFGIAKLAEGSRAEDPHGVLDETGTPTGGQTQTGAILGTPAYMAPEQVRGEHVDARTDIFTLGAVLYEMLSGQRPFPGGSLVESGHAILHENPAPLPNEVPSAVAQVVRRCLEKEPTRRFQSASDLAFALELLRSPTGSTGSVLRASRVLPRRAVWFIGAAAAAVLAALLVGLAVGGRRPPPPPPTVERVTLRPTYLGVSRFTPDGRVVFTARDEQSVELFERNLASASSQRLGLQNMELAAVSPKGELAVLLPPTTRFSGSPVGLWDPSVRRTLARVPAGGGTPRAVAEDVVAADWSPSGELAIVRREAGVHSVEFPLGKSLFKTTAPGWIRDLRVSPRGDLLAFIRYPTGVLSGEVIVLDLQGNTRQLSRRWHRLWGLAWSPQNEVWFTAGEGGPQNQIQALPVAGPERTIYTGLPGTILRDVAPDGSSLITHGLFWTDIVFLREGTPSQRSLAWNDRSDSPILSADGRLVLFFARGTRGETLALLRETSGAPPQILGDGYGVGLSPDGRWALVLSPDEKTLNIVPTGAGAARSVSLPGGFDVGAARWLGTNRAFFIARTSADTDFRLYSIDLNGSGATPLSEPGVHDYLEVSPDERWAATLDTMERPVLHPLAGGKAVLLTELEPGSAPAGWASKDELWFARVDDANPAVIRLSCFDITRRRIVKQRTVSPIVETGAGPIQGVQVTPDGKSIVFTQTRVVGHLYVLRGLGAGGR
jgi:serine/threonine protein kinase